MKNVQFNFNYNKKQSLLNNIRLANLKKEEKYESKKEYLELKDTILKDNIHSINTNIKLFENLYNDYSFDKELAYSYAYSEMAKVFDKYEPSIAKITNGEVRGASFWWYSQSAIRNGIKKAIRENLGCKASEFKVLNYVNAYFKNNGELPNTEVLATSYLKRISPKTMKESLSSLELLNLIGFNEQEYYEKRYDYLKSFKNAVKHIDYGVEVLTKHFIEHKKHREYCVELGLTFNQCKYITSKIISACQEKLKFDNINKNASNILRALSRA